VKARTEPSALAVAVALFVAAAFVRLHALRASPYPTGIDGYWYLLQARSLLEHGRLYSPSLPLVPWLMAGLSSVMAPILALKVIAALGTALLVIPAYAVGRRIAGAAGPALLGAALVATSAQSFYLGTEFVKQGVGLSLAMVFLASLLAWLDEPRRARGALTALLLLLCALAHKTALVLALVFAAPPLAARLWPLRQLRSVRVGLAAAGAAVLLLLWRARADWAVLRHLFRGGADLSFAVLATPGRPPLLLGHEVAIAAGLAVAALGLACLRRPEGGPRLPWAAAGIVAFAIFLGLPWLDIADDQGLGYRLRLCACVVLAPCAALVASRILHGLRPSAQRAACALAIGLVLILRPWSSDEGVIKAHPAMVEATSRLLGALPSDATVVVPERHTAYLAAWYGRVDIHLRPPAILDQRRTFRLLPGAEIRPGLWAALDALRAHPVAAVAPALPLHPLHPNGLVLLSEPTFQYLLGRIPEPERRWYETWVVQ
jgi:hypothetical protein